MTYMSFIELYEYDRDTVALDLQNTCTHTLHVCEVFDVIEGCREKVENLHAITSLSHTGELSPQGCAIAIAILGRRLGSRRAFERLVPQLAALMAYGSLPCGSLRHAPPPGFPAP